MCFLVTFFKDVFIVRDDMCFLVTFFKDDCVENNSDRYLG